MCLCFYLLEKKFFESKPTFSCIPSFIINNSKAKNFSEQRNDEIQIPQLIRGNSHHLQVAQEWPKRIQSRNTFLKEETITDRQ